MSIWVSLDPIGRDPWYPEDAHPGYEVRSYASGWSNHYPTTDGTVERDAFIDLADIPAWCAGGHDGDFESVGPWLRLGVYSPLHDWNNPSNVIGQTDATVVMDERAVAALVERLTEWLHRPKVHRPTGDDA